MESGTPQREYECSLGLVLFVIGRCTHLGMLNSICYLLHHVCSWIRSDWRMLSVSDLIVYQFIYFIHSLFNFCIFKLCFSTCINCIFIII